MNKYKKLVNNSAIFVIGNFGSKIISLVMVPLYTYVLTTSQYGTVDLFTTTVSLLVPIMSCSIGEAVLRFVMLTNINKQQRQGVFTSAITLNIVSQLLFSLIVFPILSYFHIFNGLLIPFIILLAFSQLQTTLSQYTRGIGKVKFFAVNGILMTFITASLNILLLVVFRLQVLGYVWSLIIANVFSVVFLFIASDGWHSFSFSAIDKRLTKKMLVYSIPLIPNMVIWWVITGSTRYFILLFLGSSVNGLFAVANKIPSILSIFTTVFQQAWQISAFEEYSSKKSRDFFSNVFRFYYELLFLGCSLIFIVLRTIIPNIIGTNFQQSWMIMPILLVSVVYQSFSSFIGTNYTASMKTKGVFISSIIGGIISVLCNLVFIPLFGVIGTGIGTLISFFVMFLYRFIDTKKFFEFTLNKDLFIMNNVLVMIQGLLLYFINSTVVIWLTQIFCFLIFAWIDREVLSLATKIIRNKIASFHIKI
ncbi:oligosaccharide flippase family protein [Lactobacillus plantarum]|nr:oligosaccharide flippase family protein [Lactiplantibacillus plantarum]